MRRVARKLAQLTLARGVKLSKTSRETRERSNVYLSKRKVNAESMYRLTEIETRP